MKKENKKTANFKFYPSFIKQLRAQSQEERRSMTSIIEYAVNLYFDSHSSGNPGVEPEGKADRHKGQQ